jgi:predicted amidohydrolase
MYLNKNSTAFDLLAILCSLLTKEEERRYAIAWAAADEEHIRDAINKNENFLAVILKASANEYRFTSGEIKYLNGELRNIKKECVKNKEEIYRLAVEVEKRLNMYSAWQNRGVIYRMDPLNINVDKTGIAIYPHIKPRWDTKKSERNRERRFNASFTNYMMIRREDISPFDIAVHYWNDDGLLQKTEKGWKLRVAMSPVMDSAMLKTEEKETASGCTVRVTGLQNDQEVIERELQIFDEIFLKEYGIIIFPEILGTETVLNEIKSRMREYPERCCFVVTPTICRDGKNTLVVLGPGGIECLQQEKTTPAILVTKDGREEREDLSYEKQVHVLVTHELGLVAFAICAELLDPDFYHLIVDTLQADTIICPSFSPGIVAFHDTLLKGAAAKILQLYINTCSAKEVSKKGAVAEPLGFVQVPYSDRKYHLWDIKRECQGRCSDKICYFDILITYQDKKFYVTATHERCA